MAYGSVSTNIFHLEHVWVSKTIPSMGLLSETLVIIKLFSMDGILRVVKQLFPIFKSVWI